MSLDRTVKWIDKTEGRDKFCKAIQYACRFLKYQFQQRGDKENAKKFDSLFGAMRDARKLFRLFKSINQYKKIQDLLKKGSDCQVDLLLNLLTRIAFGIYWFFDNLAILSKLKIINQDPKSYSKTGALFWLIALVTNLILVIKQTIANEKKIQNIKRNYISSPNQKQVQEKRKEYISFQKKRFGLTINFLKLIGDMVPAGQASQFLPNVLGIKASDGACGLGGLLSAVISSYQLYE